MTMQLDRRTAIAHLGLLAAGLVFARQAHARRVIRGVITVRHSDGSTTTVGRTASLPPTPPAGTNTNPWVLVLDDLGRPYPGVRVDSQYRRIGTSAWTYYGGQRSQSDGYARFNPFFLPPGSYEINFYTSFGATDTLTITIR
jgi:hypothetical protein